MASARDTATFFTEGSASQFQYVLSLYPQALRLKAERKTRKPEELIKLDNWYQNELPMKIKQRGKDAHLNHEELVQLMKWKQCRGKAYPQLNYLVKVNTPRAVMAETKKAFRKLPNLEQAITALSNLKGVGTTMASALLAAAAPETAPFMADECLMAIPEIEGIDYTTKEYLNFVQHIQSTAERLNKESNNGHGTWNPHQVELALWTHFVANELDPDLLNAIPSANGKSSVTHQNGEVKNASNNENDHSDNESSIEAGKNEEETNDSLASGTSATNDSTTNDADATDQRQTDEESQDPPPAKKSRVVEAGEK
ncbi:conserved hypothetical protein [Pediculus humanus corporis]|uniref:Uncharacterized protein n=1 Tax=Pediculus humanus subsp. corporis TaxID=121224 RepID=E0VST2_PEDHC|nr:uncharacterized protein Phum_PHUM423130 [Pediculus humanus corporis]EEB16438.1 conserved hypothetical protein [Pediculus humanus corporis]